MKTLVSRSWVAAMIALLAVAAGLALVVAAEGDMPRKAPDFTLANYDGKNVALADYKGKIVVLEWFNYECPFVKYHYEGRSTMVDIANKYRDKNVVWLAVNSTSHQKTEQNKEFAAKNNVPYPVLDDRAGKVGRAYGALRTPHIFIIDAEGSIVYEGGIDNAPMGKAPAGKEIIAYVDNALAELTAGKAVSAAKTEPYGCTVKYAN
jgi:peroxiredoxin